MTAYTPKIDAILDTGEAILHGGGKSCPIVISTRIRLARNLAGRSFPGWAKDAQRALVLENCLASLGRVMMLEN
ncbi:MAG: hypothetical protein WC360_07095, partial [Opitutales bacterium]